jgi:hypothetical protein
VRQHGRIEFVAERLGAKPAQQRLLIERAARDHFHVTEAARIVEDDVGTGGHPKQHVVMRGVLGPRGVKLAGRGLVVRHDDAKRARHAQVHQQHVARGEIGHEIFCTAAQARDDLPLEPGHEIGLEGKAQIGPAGLRDDDFRTLHDGLKAAADGLDFGQFRHGQAFTL